MMDDEVEPSSVKHAYTGAWKGASTALSTCGGSASAVPLSVAEGGGTVDGTRLRRGDLGVVGMPGVLGVLGLFGLLAPPGLLGLLAAAASATAKALRRQQAPRPTGEGQRAG